MKLTTQNEVTFNWVSYCGGICLLKIDNHIKVIEYDTDCIFPTPLANGKMIADVKLKGVKDGEIH